jgi:L-amino acid N-acyltransferase YncA
MGSDSFPQTVDLRGAGTAVITPLEPGDAVSLLDFYRDMSEEDRRFLRDDVTSAEWAEGFLRKVERGEIISLVAKIDDTVVGVASLYRSLHGWTRHVGEFRMAVQQPLRRKGLGSHLASALVHVATDLGIEKVIVQVVDGQVGARRSFEKLGFHREAVLARHVMDVHGTKRDLILLASDISQIWAAMEVMNQVITVHLPE